MADEADTDRQSPPNGMFDDPPTGYNNEQLDPDMTQLFPDDEHIHSKDESEEQHQARTEATNRQPPKHKRYYSQEANKPTIRSGPVASDKSDTEGFVGNDELFFQPEDSPKDLDQIDAGMFFADSQPEVANKLAGRRGRDGPAQLHFASRTQESSSTPRMATWSTPPPEISSATFIRDLEKHVSDPDAKSKLLEHFRTLNDHKNAVAFNTFELYKQKNEEYENVMKDYYAGAGEERRRVRVEAELRDKENRRKRKEQMIQSALDQELRDAESGWNFDPLTGALASLESDEEHVGDEDGKDGQEDGGDGADTDEKGQREFYSDDDDEWPGDQRSRMPLSASTDASNDRGTPRSHRTRSSTYSLDKPLPATPAIPMKETQQSMISIDILLRLLPVKVALIEQTDLKHPDRKVIYAICERASAICEHAEQQNASWALQGRCAFYMGLAEYMRSRVDGESDQLLPAVILYFEHAWKLCGGVYEEGVWGEEWARLLGEEMEGLEGCSQGAGKDPSSLPLDDRGERSLVDRTIGMMKSGVKNSWDRLMGRNAVEPEPETNERGSRSSSNRARSQAGPGQRWFGPDHVKASSCSEELSSKSPKPSGLALNTEGVEAKNTVLLPSEGVGDSPEKYANGFDKPPAVSSGHSPKAGLMQALDHAVSPHTKRAPAAPAAPIRRYRIVNPDPPSADTSGDSKEADLPAPVTNASPAVSPDGDRIMTALGRRLSSTFSPTSDTPPKPTFNLRILEKRQDEVAAEDADDTEKEGENKKRLSIAARRTSVQKVLGVIRGKMPERSTDSLAEAEEGNSPSYQTSFDLECLRHPGAAKKSPLSDEADESGLRRRRSAGKTDGDIV